MSKQIGTLADFADWLGTMPADEEYDYMDNHGCAIFCYLRARGMPVSSVDGYGWHDTNDMAHCPPEFHALDRAVVLGSRTFGAAHKRALAAL